MWLIYMFGVMGGITLLFWGFDKYRARTHQWRVPERWLFALTLAGGSFGALAGMVFFRHKIRKTYFWIMVLGSIALHSYLWLTIAN